MRVRARDSNGDMQFGHGAADFFVDNTKVVEQKIITRLNLFLGEFFLNTAAGMPWKTKVIGYGTQSLYDPAIKNQILGTAGVTGITTYTSSLNPATRVLTINVLVQTQFGPLKLSTSLSFAPPPTGGYGVGLPGLYGE